MIEQNTLLTVAGGIFSIGFIYASLKTQINSLRDEVKTMKETHSRIIAVESKLDILINHFIK